MKAEKTTDDLRKVLFDTLDDVRAGRITTAQARAVADHAQKIIDVTDLEIRYAETLSRLDKEDQGLSPGRILLTSEAAPGGSE